MKVRKGLLAMVAASLLMGGQGTGTAFAAPTADEAAQLGKTLTPLGAIKAGNADGSIPAWDGGLCKPVAGYKPTNGKGGWPYVDPYANEKPLYSINASNLSKYADQVPEGTAQLLQRYADSYRLDVYPTHRTACFPDWAYRNTIERVMNPKLVGNTPGITGAHAQFPFPIPKSGAEAMWNALLNFYGPYEDGSFLSYLGDAAGNVIQSAGSTSKNDHLYWDNSLTGLDDSTAFWRLIALQSEPPSAAGTAQMRWQFQRTDLNDAKAWIYIPGQRRVRLAPEFTYDTVATASGGVLLYDEINAFDGKMDKYDLKLVGRKEMIVPYNSYRRWSSPQEQVVGKFHVVPEAERWEKHRVWVVEGTLKPGERHIQKRKKFYIDEDSWIIVAYTGFDQQDKPHHYMVIHPVQEYEKPMMRGGFYDLYDLSKGNRTANTTPGRDGIGYVWRDAGYPSSTFTPSGLTGQGVR